MTSTRDHKNLKIFLVDDDVFNLKITKFHLKRLGYEDVTTFDNGKDCLDNILLKPNVVFLDQYMDGLQGIDVLVKIRALMPNVIVIMLSAEDSEASATFFKEHGAFEYIIKSNEAIHKIAEVLSRVNQELMH